MTKKSKFRSLLLSAALISGFNGHGSAAKDERSGSEAISQCNALTDGHSLMRDERNVFPDQQDYEKLVIYRAIRCQDVDQVGKLLDDGLDPNISLNGGGLAYWAAVSGSIPVLKLLFEHGAEIDCQEGDFAPGPLIGAIDHAFPTDDWSVYEFLLSQGADPEIRCGNPTLTTAENLTLTGEFEKIDELLDRGYDRDLLMLRHFVERTLETSLHRKQARLLLERIDSQLR